MSVFLFLLAVSGIMAALWLGGRAYDWILHRAMERASNDTSWADDDH